MSEFTTPGLTEALSEILGVFGGEDGGGGYWKLCQLLRQLDDELQAGGEKAATAKQLVDVVLKFHRLLKAAQRGPTEAKAQP